MYRKEGRSRPLLTLLATKRLHIPIDLEMKLSELGSSLRLASLEMGIVVAVSQCVLRCIGSFLLFFKLPNR